MAKRFELGAAVAPVGAVAHGRQRALGDELVELFGSDARDRGGVVACQQVVGCIGHLAWYPVTGRGNRA